MTHEALAVGGHAVEVQRAVGLGEVVVRADPRATSKRCQSTFVAEGGALLLAEVVGPGRQARGESLAYDFFNSETEVRRPDGRLLFRDTTRLSPADNLASLGLLGAWQAIGTLYAIAGGLDASVFNSTMARCEEIGLLAGCSELPNAAGMWFRVMAHDVPSAHDAVRAAWTAARVQILGFVPPASRRY